VEKRAVLARNDQAVRVVERLVIPARRNSGRKKRLDLRRDVQLARVQRIEQRLDAEAVARGEKRLCPFVPQYEREFAAHLFETGRSVVLVEVERDLAVTLRAKPVAATLELALDAFVVVELAVDDGVNASVFVLERLISRRKVDDGKSRVAEAGAAVGGNPGALRIGTAVE